MNDLLAVGEQKKLHPLTMVTHLGDLLKQAWGAAAGAAFFAYQGQWWLVGLILGLTIFGSLIKPLIMWLSFSYAVGEDGIEMRSGVLSRNHRAIPFDRVQDVNLEQNILHRALGMAKVKLETGGSAGGKTEDGVIDSITLEEAARLRDTIRVHRSGAVASVVDGETPVLEEQEGREIFSMPPRRVLVAGIFNFSLAVLGVLFGAAQTVGDLAGINPFSGRFWRNLSAESVPYLDLLLANQVVTAIFGFISLVFVGLATGVIQTALRDWNFRLSRTESGLRRRRGLFTLTDVVLPLKRVQAMILATGPIRRRFGWSALKLQSLARDSAHGGDHVVAPLANPTEIDQIVAAMDWRAIDRDATGWTGPTIAFFASFAIIFGPLILLALAMMTQVDKPLVMLIPTALFAAILAARYVAWHHHAYKRDGDRLMIRSGALRQRNVILPLDRIQSVDLSRDPIDRMFGVVTVIFGVAGGRGFDKHAIVAIPQDAALALRSELVDEAA